VATCGVGLILAVPVTAFSLAYAYRHLTQGPAFG
jgi:uncharacterized membrane protein